MHYADFGTVFKEAATRPEARETNADKQAGADRLEAARRQIEREERARDES